MSIYSKLKTPNHIHFQFEVSEPCVCHKRYFHKRRYKGETGRGFPAHIQDTLKKSNVDTV